jgi:hypothetical protein
MTGVPSPLPAVSARLSAEAAILAGRLAALIRHVLSGSGAGDPLAEGRSFLEEAFEAATGGASLADFEGSALARPDPDGPHPVDWLAATLALDDPAVDLLLLAGLPEEHEGYASVLRTLHPRGEPWLPVGLAAQLLCPDAVARLALRAALETGPLVRCGVLAVLGEGPFHERSLRLADGLWSCLHGLDALPSGLARFAAVASPVGLGEWLDGPRSRRAAELLAARAPCTVLVSGEDGEALHWRGCALVQATGREPLGLVLPAVPDADLQRLVQAHALVRGAVPVVRLQEAEQGAETGPAVELLADFPDALVLCARPGAAAGRPALPLLQVPAGPLGSAARRAMWRDALPALSAEAAGLAARFPVEPLTAARVAGDLALLAGSGAGAEAGSGATGGGPTADDLAACLRARTGLRLGGAVKLLRPTADWSDLVLPADALAHLREAVDRLRLQAKVLDEWGFLKGRPGVRGVRMLFAGPPGTGKTLAAEVMASALRTDLLVVDLSRVVSKWIGETEKNLATVFDSAERAQAVLLFDEADALFGRRTEVTDAHDRYANLETAYLLQRLERFEGLTVLATNLRRNLDPAFTRRLEVAVDFAEPDQPAREAIWRAHVPSAAPLDPDLSFRELAALYPVVGGLIRNAAVAGAFLAAAEGVPIGRAHLVRALRREYTKAGRAFPGLPPGLCLPS